MASTLICHNRLIVVNLICTLHALTRFAFVQKESARAQQVAGPTNCIYCECTRASARRLSRTRCTNCVRLFSISSRRRRRERVHTMTFTLSLLFRGRSRTTRTGCAHSITHASDSFAHLQQQQQQQQQRPSSHDRNLSELHNEHNLWR